MLKEQLFGLAMKAYSRAFEARERIKKTMSSDGVQNYVRALKSVAIQILEKRWGPSSSGEETSVWAKNTPDQTSRNPRKVIQKKAARKPQDEVGKKSSRRISVRPAKDIDSAQADIVIQNLKNGSYRMVSKSETLEGKRSLAYLIWALGHAELAEMKGGISVHDVSALLYRACKIELYPINISRVVYGNQALVQQVGQEKRTKKYLLTKEGQAIFREKFL